MNEQDNVKVVQQAYASFKAGDIEALLNAMSDDVDWRLPDIKNIPFAGKRRGREAVAQFFASIGESQEALEFEPREFIAQGDKVVALGHYTWRVQATRREFAADFAHVFTVRGGKIAGMHEFTDTAAASAAYA